MAVLVINLSNMVEQKTGVTMKEQALPLSVFRKRVAYRTLGTGGKVGTPGCGFLLKPTRSGEIRDNRPSDYVAVYVLRGEGTYVDWNGRSHPLFPGCVAQRLPGKRHSTLLVPDGQWAECFLVLNHVFYDTMVMLGSMDPDRPVLNPGLHRALVDQFEAILSDLAQTSGKVPPHTLLRAHELILAIYALDKAAQAPDHHAEMVQVACSLLGKKLADRLSLPELAASFKMSYERFRKVFRERTGVSPGAYRIQRRVEHACRLLSEERMPVKEAAYVLGYPDIYSFSRQFRQIIGAAPSTFRHGIK